MPLPTSLVSVKSLARRVYNRFRFAAVKCGVQIARWFSVKKSLQIYLTVSDLSKTNGGGAQLHARASCLALSDALGCKFTNTPLEVVDHAPSDQSDWTMRWNSLMNFDAISSPRLPGQSFEQRSLGSLIWRVILSRNFEVIAVNLVNPTLFTDADPSSWQKVSSKLKSVLRAPGSLSHHDEVCGHYRLWQPKDVGDQAIRSSALLPVIKALGELANQFPQSQITLFVSPDASFDSSAVPRTISIDTSDAPEAFWRMCNAKALVIGKSSLSFLAGILCEGEVYCPEFWHTPKPGWRLLNLVETH